MCKYLPAKAMYDNEYLFEFNLLICILTENYKILALKKSFE